MMFLTRKPGQTIMIDGDISVTIKSINGSQVELGIIAPKHVPVDRLENHIKKINKAKLALVGAVD